MNLKAFSKLLSLHLYPILRNEGFRGSGATLHRVRGEVVHIFNVQGSSGAERCYLNLGTHLSFLTGTTSRDADPLRLHEYECAFRSRLDPPSDQPFGWIYGSSQAEAEANVGLAVAAWEEQGRTFFSRYYDYPADFAQMVRSTSAESVHPAACLTLARIAQRLGESERMKDFAKSGIDRAGERASGLRHSLSQLLGNSTGASSST